MDGADDPAVVHNLMFDDDLKSCRVVSVGIQIRIALNQHWSIAEKVVVDVFHRFTSRWCRGFRRRYKSELCKTRKSEGAAEKTIHD